MCKFSEVMRVCLSELKSDSKINITQFSDDGQTKSKARMFQRNVCVPVGEVTCAFFMCLSGIIVQIRCSLR